MASQTQFKLRVRAGGPSRASHTLKNPFHSRRRDRTDDNSSTSPFKKHPHLSLEGLE